MVRRFFAITLFAGCLAAALPAWAEDFAAHFTPTSPPVAVPLFSFNDALGRTMDLRDFKGHYVLLNLWATWCSPCVKEMASLDALQGQIGGRINVLALTEDHDGLGAAQAFYKRHKLSHLPVFVDTAGEAPYILHTRGLPTTIFIDPNGMEIGRIEGEADWDDPSTVTFLESQMNRTAEKPTKTVTK